jgi:hypothetical protein
MGAGTAEGGGFSDPASAYRDDTASHDTGAGEYTGSHQSNDLMDANGATDANAPHHDRFRTVADKIMGREPTGEA